MGQLDDAIRDHLDLKRRRGADPDEIARLEHEALGPVRRQPFEREEEARSRAEGAEGSRTDEQEPELSERDSEKFYEEEYGEEEGAQWEEPFAERDEASLDRPRSRSRPSESSAIEQPSKEEPRRESRRWRRFRRANIPPEDAPPTQASPPETPEDQPTGEETLEYEVDEALRSPARGSEDELSSRHGSTEDEGDVPEETPESLQDAPEHDRLRFEQRPPRDFDFDD